MADQPNHNTLEATDGNQLILDSQGTTGTMDTVEHPSGNNISPANLKRHATPYTETSDGEQEGNQNASPPAPPFAVVAPILIQKGGF